MSTRYAIYDGPEGPLLLAVDDDGNARPTPLRAP